MLNRNLLSAALVLSALAVNSQPGVAQRSTVEVNRQTVKVFEREYPDSVGLDKFRLKNAELIASQGVQVVGLLKKGAAIQLTASNTCKRGLVSALAFSQNFNGSPYLGLKVNGKLVSRGRIEGERYLDNYYLTPYDSPIFLKEGATVEVTFLNDAYRRGKGDRNAFVRSIGFECLDK